MSNRGIVRFSNTTAGKGDSYSRIPSHSRNFSKQVRHQQNGIKPTVPGTPTTAETPITAVTPITAMKPATVGTPGGYKEAAGSAYNEVC